MNKVLCGNCDQLINEGVFILHQVYCERMIQRCDLCDQKYDLTLKDEHDDTHEKVQNQFEEKNIKQIKFAQLCIHCKQKILSKFYQQHIDDCDQKMIRCLYCQLDTLSKDYVNHVEKCGNRTEKCQLCNVPIRLSFIDEHVQMCSFSILDSGEQFDKQQQQQQQQKLQQQEQQQQQQQQKQKQDLSKKSNNNLNIKDDLIHISPSDDISYDNLIKSSDSSYSLDKDINKLKNKIQNKSLKKQKGNQPEKRTNLRPKKNQNYLLDDDNKQKQDSQRRIRQNDNQQPILQDSSKSEEENKKQFNRLKRT